MSKSDGTEALEIHPLKISYNPPDGEFNIWMYTMIFIGCSFVLFVIASVYIMCNSPQRRESSNHQMRRIPTVRDRDSHQSFKVNQHLTREIL